MGRDIYMYVDESGNLDYAPDGKMGASSYFGFGTAVFNGDHAAEIFASTRLRMVLAHRGTDLTHGYHAVNDSYATKAEVFPMLHAQDYRFDSTFLLKENAYSTVKQQGQMRLYKMAWYLHFKEIARQVANKDDTLWVVAAQFGTKKRAAEAREAIRDVCNQVDRDIRLSVWSASTSWGLQAADYALWATARLQEGKTCGWYEPYVKPHVASIFKPWGSKS